MACSESSGHEGSVRGGDGEGTFLVRRTVSFKFTQEQNKSAFFFSSERPLKLEAASRGEKVAGTRKTMPHRIPFTGCDVGFDVFSKMP